MDIDESAPIRAGGSIEIGATPSDVWAAMTDVGRWPSWNRQIREASLEGPLAPGATLRWKAGPGTIRSVIRAVEHPRELGWTGRTMGVDAVHVWRLEPAGYGTRVTTEESWRGWPTRLMRRRLARTLEEAIAAGLADLKAEVERRARAARDDTDRVETAA
jgi:hypothetical protein